MNLKPEELKLVLKWFDIAEESLDDEDLKLYDKMKDSLEDLGIDLAEEEEENDDDELTFYIKPSKDDDDLDDDFDYERYGDEREED